MILKPSENLEENCKQTNFGHTGLVDLAGLRPVCLEGTYAQDGDLLNTPAKRRHSPRPATQNAAVLSAPLPPLPRSPAGISAIRYGRNIRLTGAS
jgi:hypothetical protein